MISEEAKQIFDLLSRLLLFLRCSLLNGGANATELPSKEVLKIRWLLLVLLFLLFTSGNVHLLRELIGKLVGGGACGRVVREIVPGLLMSAILDLGVCQVEKLRKLFLALVILRFNWFFPHYLESILLERFNAWALVIGEGAGNVTELIEISNWLTECGLLLLLESPAKLIEGTHADTTCLVLVHLRLLHPIGLVGREHGIIAVSHVRISHGCRIRLHHVGSIGGIGSELPRVLSHLSHILHYLVQLRNRVKLLRLSCWLLLLLLLLLLEVGINRLLLGLLLLHRGVERNLLEEVKHRLRRLFLGLADI